uniref:lytic transglycosylase domain-containing protein n=1 Tax=Sandarakinorhabdus sp. TaxID=1916663 RepID=UPI00286EABC1
DQTTAAGRMLARIDTDHRLLALTRIALRRGGAPADVAARLAVVTPALQRDPGLIFDRAGWLRRAGRLSEAQAMLVTDDLDAGMVSDADRWLTLRLEIARAAWRSGAHETAWKILASHQVRAAAAMPARPLSERLLYSDTEFLAGWIALRKLGRAETALRHFRNLRAAVTTPVSQARADYWSGRAALALNQPAAARVFFTAAATHPDYFYGQLAAAQIGQALVLNAAASPTPAPSAFDSFRSESRVRAAAALGEIGAHGLQTVFLKQLAETTDNTQRLAMLAALGGRISRPDAGVYAGKAARSGGELALLGAAFPRLALPSSLSDRTTLIHAITRQESQFDPRARSSAGAVGLMQLLPSTAAEQAGKLGLPFSAGGLTSDPIFNVTLGSAYFNRLRTSFGGNWPLAIAAYNAGPGNARRIMATIGDPRDASVDAIDWIESIPFSETRTYVQRVIENAVVYDRLMPQTATFGSANPVMTYLAPSAPLPLTFPGPLP